MASGREAIMALRLAAAVGHLDAAAVDVDADRIDCIVAILFTSPEGNPDGIAGSTSGAGGASCNSRRRWCSPSTQR
ncbi:MAG: hypothetical protein AAGN82_15680 [Myxococcota bacterium]